jgi:hypothetical protein
VPESLFAGSGVGSLFDADPSLLDPERLSVR